MAAHASPAWPRAPAGSEGAPAAPAELEGPADPDESPSASSSDRAAAGPAAADAVPASGAAGAAAEARGGSEDPEGQPGGTAAHAPLELVGQSAEPPPAEAEPESGGSTSAPASGSGGSGDEDDFGNDENAAPDERPERGTGTWRPEGLEEAGPVSAPPSPPPRSPGAGGPHSPGARPPTPKPGEQGLSPKPAPRPSPRPAGPGRRAPLAAMELDAAPGSPFVVATPRAGSPLRRAGRALAFPGPSLQAPESPAAAAAAASGAAAGAERAREDGRASPAPALSPRPRAALERGALGSEAEAAGVSQRALTATPPSAAALAAAGAHVPHVQCMCPHGMCPDVLEWTATRVYYVFAGLPHVYVCSHILRLPLSCMLTSGSLLFLRQRVTCAARPRRCGRLRAGQRRRRRRRQPLCRAARRAARRRPWQRARGSARPSG